LMSSTQ